MCSKVCDMERRVRQTKSNIEQIEKTMAAWSLAPLYQRREDRKDSLLGIEVSLHLQDAVVEAPLKYLSVHSISEGATAT